MCDRFRADEKVEATENVKLTTSEVQGQIVTSVVFDQCSLEDAADIKVVATNPAGEDSCVASLTVQSECEYLSANYHTFYSCLNDHGLCYTNVSVYLFKYKYVLST